MGASPWKPFPPQSKVLKGRQEEFVRGAVPSTLKKIKVVSLMLAQRGATNSAILPKIRQPFTDFSQTLTLKFVVPSFSRNGWSSLERWATGEEFRLTDDDKRPDDKRPNPWKTEGTMAFQAVDEQRNPAKKSGNPSRRGTLPKNPATLHGEADFFRPVNSEIEKAFAEQKPTILSLLRRRANALC